MATLHFMGRPCGLPTYLGAGIGTGEQASGNLASEGGGLAGLASVAERLHSGDGDLLLVEASLGEGHEDRKDKSLRHGRNGSCGGRNITKAKSI